MLYRFVLAAALMSTASAVAVTAPLTYRSQNVSGDIEFVDSRLLPGTPSEDLWLELASRQELVFSSLEEFSITIENSSGSQADFLLDSIYFTGPDGNAIPGFSFSSAEVSQSFLSSSKTRLTVAPVGGIGPVSIHDVHVEGFTKPGGPASFESFAISMIGSSGSSVDIGGEVTQFIDLDPGQITGNTVWDSGRFAVGEKIPTVNISFSNMEHLEVDNFESMLIRLDQNLGSPLDALIDGVSLLDENGDPIAGFSFDANDIELTGIGSGATGLLIEPIAALGPVIFHGIQVDRFLGISGNPTDILLFAATINGVQDSGIRIGQWESQAAVPEPGTYALLISMLAIVAVRRPRYSERD
jgi:hypothetical protein